MGLLTNIQRFSLNDGPGIRSTVFFKGCNMRCGWCHNPETLSLQPQLLRYPDKCIGCGACEGTIALPSDQLAGREKYADLCFAGALELCGQETSVQEILDEVLQDLDYYKNSGGGVTLSGGEVLLQAEFARALLLALKEQGVHTAIETNFSFPYEVIEPLVGLVDLFMIDVKLGDDALHSKHTGLPNGRVLENIRKLDKTGTPFILRTPVIPGVNDTEQEIARIAATMQGLAHLKYYELLNFNPLGASKYNGLGMENIFASAKPLPEEEIQALAAVAKQTIANVRIG